MEENKHPVIPSRGDSCISYLEARVYTLLQIAGEDYFPFMEAIVPLLNKESIPVKENSRLELTRSIMYYLLSRAGVFPSFQEVTPAQFKNILREWKTLNSRNANDLRK